MWSFFFPPELREHLRANCGAYIFLGALVLAGVAMAYMATFGK